MNEFATLAFILSFPGMILVVTILTQVTKNLVDRLFNFDTQYLVYFYSLMLCIVAALVNGDFTTINAGLETALVWFVNSAIIWLSAMKAFEKVIEKPDGTIKVDSSDPEKDLWLLDLKGDMPVLRDGSTLKFKVDAKKPK